MGRKHRHRRAVSLKLNLHKAFSDRGRQFDKYYPCLAQFMGRDNAFFLCAIHELNDYFEKRGMVKDGVMFFNQAKFQRDKRISTYLQRKALKQISALSILTVTGRRAVHQQVYIQFNKVACFAWGLLISDIPEKCYKKLWRIIQTSPNARDLIRREVKRLENEWSDAELDEDRFSKSFHTSYKLFYRLVKDIYHNKTKVKRTGRIDLRS